MKSWQERLTVILPLQQQDDWDARTYGIPKVTARLRLAVSSLIAHDPRFVKKPHDQALNVLMQNRNRGVRKIFSEHSDVEIAFALRDARN